MNWSSLQVRVEVAVLILTITSHAKRNSFRQSWFPRYDRAYESPLTPSAILALARELTGETASTRLKQFKGFVRASEFRLKSIADVQIMQSDAFVADGIIHSRNEHTRVVVRYTVPAYVGVVHLLAILYAAGFALFSLGVLLSQILERGLSNWTDSSVVFGLLGFPFFCFTVISAYNWGRHRRGPERLEHELVSAFSLTRVEHYSLEGEIGRNAFAQ
jgi:hypothetical protein